ncbi:CBS domain-containing protein [Caballeronia sp. S22]|uniref:CBS domain-containing protein n=1 Tax=Caballeronia sp. S22 TaxID=3137182 RepID=UPI0035309AB5
MTSVAEVMTRDAVTLGPTESMRQAAKIMDELNVGALPICDGEKLVGMLTDRDIVVRGVSAGASVDTPIESLLSEPVAWCFETDDVADVQERMAREQIRRMPVVDNQKHLIGIIAIGDIATNADGQISSTIAAVSAPSKPDR